MTKRLWLTRTTGWLLTLLLAAAAFLPARQAAQASSQHAPRSDVLPAETCVLDSGTNTRTCELWAKTGSITMPGGATVNILGYADTADGAASLPGPMIIANQGETVQVIVNNTLAEPTALIFSGAGGKPDLTGIAPGGSGAYTLTDVQPGTYLYEAGPLPNAQHQVAMGLYGGLIVRPAGAPGQAYAGAESAFNDEALLVLSEVDPALNNSANPAAFDLRAYAPKYFMINGKAYPETAPIPTAAGNSVLLRLINAGVNAHSASLLGLRKTVLSTDGSPFTYSHRAVAETLAPGQTADVLVGVPANAPAGARYAFYDANLLLHNNNQSSGTTVDFGGMLTFLVIPDGTGGGDTSGPVTGSVALSPNPTGGGNPVSVSAGVDDVTTGGGTITAAEFFIDATGANGSGMPMAAQDGAFDEVAEAVNGALDTATLAGLASGSHTIYVHGQDAAGNWGAFNFATLNLDKTGPATTGVTLTPKVSNGSMAIALKATGNDSTTGGANIVAAEYTLDGGAAVAMAVTSPASISSLTATIPAGLAAGDHALAVRSQDAHGNWGGLATAVLRIDQTGPVASNVLARPNPNNGTLGYTASIQSVRVDASLADAGANVSAVEGFIDATGSSGTGFPFTPADGSFNGPNENAYAFIPLATVRALSEGSHTLSVHGRDSAGNWGAFATTSLLVDKTRPTVSGVTAATGPGNSVTLSAAATDTATNLTAAEWYEGTDPGAGRGTALQAADGTFNSTSEGLTGTISTLSGGSHTLYVRAKDAAGNWSLVGSVVVNIAATDAIFADGFESANFSAWSLATGAGISTTNVTPLVGAYSMRAAITGNTPGFVTDSTPNNETSYFARFNFDPRGTLTGTSQHDIFSGVNNAGTVIFRVQYRRTTAGGGTYQVRAQVVRAGGVTNSNWYNITNNTSNTIEIEWNSGASAAFRLYVNGTLQQTMTGLNTSAYQLGAVRLGPSAGLTTGMSGAEYFDAFVSRRYTRP